MNKDTENNSTVLITGAAGFIGFHLAERLLDLGHKVIGIDSFDPYYDVSLKKQRISIIKSNKNFKFYQSDITIKDELSKIFFENKMSAVVHLAAQAGVRYSIDNPRAYVHANINGTLEVLECCKTHRLEHLMIASTSSVYGGNTIMPFTEVEKADTQMSLYAASKKATESMSHSYSHLFGLPVTCFRFFTVYGPWGRPDMALFKFTKAIKENKPIDVYNNGDMERDFTYISDLTKAITLLIKRPPDLIEGKVNEADSISSIAPWRVVNIGNSQPVKLLDYISNIERCLGKQAIKNMLPMQAGDVPATIADNALLKALTGFCPQTTTEYGIKKFVDWYNNYYV